MNIEYEKAGKIAILTLNRPEALNTLSPDLMNELHDALENFRADDDLWVGIITGTGQKAFCAGADIKTWLPFVKKTKDRPWLFPSTPMRGGMELWKPLIAAINGIAMGGGLELALACDLRIASENARFASPEVKLGIMSRLGGTVRLPDLIGLSKATEMMLMGDPIDAQEAYRIGLVNKVVPSGQVMPVAKGWAEKLCKVSPLSSRRIKEALTKNRGLSIEESLWLENMLALPLYETEDYEEGRKAFKEKRSPDFKAK
jgi:enoyl-CoA hydratase/carnithine racemase